jgi:hypothetical protein
MEEGKRQVGELTPLGNPFVVRGIVDVQTEAGGHGSHVFHVLSLRGLCRRKAGGGAARAVKRRRVAGF